MTSHLSLCARLSNLFYFHLYLFPPLFPLSIYCPTVVILQPISYFKLVWLSHSSVIFESVTFLRVSDTVLGLDGSKMSRSRLLTSTSQSKGAVSLLNRWSQHNMVSTKTDICANRKWWLDWVHNSVTHITQERPSGITGWDGDNVKEISGREEAWAETWK